METGNIVVTGGCGFIGLEVSKQLAQQNRRMLLMDNLSPQIHGDVPNLSSKTQLHDPKIAVLRGDVAKASDWRSALSGANCVIHLAAETGTAQSMYEISRYADINVGGTAAMLDYLANQKHKVRKIILASSRSVYGEGAYCCGKCGAVYPEARTAEMLAMAQWEQMCPKCGGKIEAMATPEDALTAPASVYAATKLAQEDLIRIAGKALGIPTVIFRFQNVYGEGQSLKNPYTGILSIFSNQLRASKTVSLYEDGKESRDFVHVSDVARAVCLSVDSNKADGNTLNVGSGVPTSVERIARLLKDLYKSDSEIVTSGQYRIGDIRHGYADISRLQDKLGFTPQISLEQGLDRFVAWVKSQPAEPDRLDSATQELAERGLIGKTCIA